MKTSRRTLILEGRRNDRSNDCNIKYLLTLSTYIPPSTRRRQSLRRTRTRMRSVQTENTSADSERLASAVHKKDIMSTRAHKRRTSIAMRHQHKQKTLQETQDREREDKAGNQMNSTYICIQHSPPRNVQTHIISEQRRNNTSYSYR